ncbi:conserved hypothetical protein [Candidatus Protochlamydia naegleriophila]|uniref:Uncharacterized protein n=1 Tax=Candidatus Protochlamydia naegleriophila TaxID=389348 RepID=A0A0U5J8B3_9BACT|nr:hypothetical protein [Candidatus Protochlamydia naegleriophila]CUI15646.1 conserved hypothetical protein [Candidatus Protochlamydia naegleriophila]
MLKTIPLNRAVAYLMVIGLLPFLFVVFLFFSQRGQLEELNGMLESLQHQAFVKEKKQALNLAVRQHFRDADHFYIDKYLETLVFLEPEIETLQKIAADKNFSNDEKIKKRLELLTSQGNSLVFSEGVVQAFPLFQETIETLVHPVEVSSTDLQKILARIEGIQIGSFAPGPNRPQLIITEFKLDKKKVNEKNEVFVLNLKLLKREFL